MNANNINVCVDACCCLRTLRPGLREGGGGVPVRAPGVHGAHGAREDDGQGLTLVDFKASTKLFYILLPLTKPR